jgi:hypothetical protein
VEGLTFPNAAFQNAPACPNSIAIEASATRGHELSLLPRDDDQNGDHGEPADAGSHDSAEPTRTERGDEHHHRLPHLQSRERRTAAGRIRGVAEWKCLADRQGSKLAVQEGFGIMIDLDLGISITALMFATIALIISIVGVTS